ncbi:DUF1214 domain-containing protein [Dactylosporangium siamense]|uniref:Membrane protein n=1 Tax=Dactylosporangium siamense TaxID=685454 RepID=A0A919UHK7_9ACTN|nr:DUF1214 domain-containing protein [Dactylosporangium siamense]GIG52496.1 membrane protein [Dactylosporangium siamense]
MNPSTEAPSRHPVKSKPKPPHGIADDTTYEYVIRFWPRALSYYQQTFLWNKHGANTLVGPDGMGPEYRSVVAINDDTLYGSAFVDLRDGPVILTIPESNGITYSLLVLDVFGNVVSVHIPNQPQGGVYALVPHEWEGPLPEGIPPVSVPYPVTIWNLRADKYKDGKNTIDLATAFRAGLRMTTLRDYLICPKGGATLILPLSNFAVSTKKDADDLAQHDPRALLDMMQRGVQDHSTYPMSTDDHNLAQQFDELYLAAKVADYAGDPKPMKAVTDAVVAAWTKIQANWKGSAGTTGWIHPTNFAQWGTDYVNRASGNEFIQFGNNAKAAGYWHAFVDAQKRPLAGTNSYVLTFRADQIPDACRFWSLTAYTPDTVELIPGQTKFVVASYTPGLYTAPDGSIAIAITRVLPPGFAPANWLPVDENQFNVMLRVYGPKDNTDPNNPPYVPPAITPMR